LVQALKMRVSRAKKADSKSSTAPGNSANRRRGCGARRSLIGPVSTPGVIGQPRAKSRGLGPGGAIPVKRRSAVTPVATAPISEKAICQTAEGIAI